MTRIPNFRARAGALGVWGGASCLVCLVCLVCLALPRRPETCAKTPCTSEPGDSRGSFKVGPSRCSSNPQIPRVDIIVKHRVEPRRRKEDRM